MQANGVTGGDHSPRRCEVLRARNWRWTSRWWLLGRVSSTWKIVKNDWGDNEEGGHLAPSFIPDDQGDCGSSDLLLDLFLSGERHRI